MLYGLVLEYTGGKIDGTLVKFTINETICGCLFADARSACDVEIEGIPGGGSPQNEAKKGASKTQCSKTITQVKNRQRRWL
jgi:hypothetical protein